MPPTSTMILPPSPAPRADGSGGPPRSRPWGWAVFGSVAAVVTLGFGVAQTVSVLAHDETTTTTEFAAQDVKVVDVDVENGRVRIVAGTGESVRVTARISRGLVDTNHREELEGDRLVLRAGCPTVLSAFCSVDYTVEVPANVTIVAHSDDSGVSVSGIDGPIAASSENGAVLIDGGRAPEVVATSQNGDVDIFNLRARSVAVHSENGSVDVELLAAPEDVRARSVNGDVTVIVPDTGEAYAVDAESQNASRAVGVPTDPRSGRSIDARSENGDVTVASRVR